MHTVACDEVRDGCLCRVRIWRAEICAFCFALTLLRTYFLCCRLGGLRGPKEMKSDLGSDLTLGLSMGKMGTLKKPYHVAVVTG